MTDTLVVQEKSRFLLNNFQLEILSYLGQLTIGIHYFKVNIENKNHSDESPKLGLLRIGSTTSKLQQELEVRKALFGYKMISELLVETIKDSARIEVRSSQFLQNLELENSETSIESLLESPLNNEQLNSFANLAEPDSDIAKLNGAEEIDEVNNEANVDLPDLTEQIIPEEGDSNEINNQFNNEIHQESEYLDEEYHPEIDIDGDGNDRKLFLLTYFPEDSINLKNRLQEDNPLESSLSIGIQVCQFFSYLHKNGWCFVQVLPQFIELGNLIKFFDLTGVYPLNEPMKLGLSGNYCAPELAYSKLPVQEAMSTYTVAALLYQSIHKQSLDFGTQIDISINPIPRIFQILKISLSHAPEERFSLSQLLNLLRETRQSLQTNKIHWQVASRSTIGLSTSRLQNEDSYGVRQLQLSNAETLIIGVVADGMGGMSQGEVASKLAVQAIFDEPVPTEFKTIEEQSEWLVSLVQKANESVSTNVKDGGTTLSVTLAIGRELAIAHVGDSRIYLLRNGEVIQLSEDHSLVAMLVASGQITYEESLDHPDRNVLIKSIGSKRRLSDGYVQSKFAGDNSSLSISLENSDILLLCSDGVWDLVSKEEMAELFTNQSLQIAVDQVINFVLDRGAPDNATLLALQIHCQKETRY